MVGSMTEGLVERGEDRTIIQCMDALSRRTACQYLKVRVAKGFPQRCALSPLLWSLVALWQGWMKGRVYTPVGCGYADNICILLLEIGGFTGTVSDLVLKALRWMELWCNLYMPRLFGQWLTRFSLVLEFPVLEFSMYFRSILADGESWGWAQGFNALASSWNSIKFK